MIYVRYLTLLVLASFAVAAFAQDAGRPDAGAAPDAGAPDAGAPGADAGLVVLAPFQDGTFVLADPASADAAVNAAIEASLRSLHPSMRDAFRAQLRVTLKFPRRLVISREASRAHLTWDATLLEAGLDGTESEQRGPEGRSIRVAMRRDQGGLSVVQRTSGFVRTDRIGGGTPDELVIVVSLRSGLLRGSLDVTASYAPLAP